MRRAALFVLIISVSLLALLKPASGENDVTNLSTVLSPPLVVSPPPPQRRPLFVVMMVPNWALHLMTNGLACVSPHHFALFMFWPFSFFP